MSLLLIIGTILCVLGGAALVLAWKGAREGYEDDAGFHRGVSPEQRAADAVAVLPLMTLKRQLKMEVEVEGKPQPELWALAPSTQR